MNKVYIVEDDPVIAGSVAGHLEKWQMKCRCAQNFEKITEEVQAYQPDIIKRRRMHLKSSIRSSSGYFSTISMAEHSLSAFS